MSCSARLAVRLPSPPCIWAGMVQRRGIALVHPLAQPFFFFPSLLVLGTRPHPAIRAKSPPFGPPQTTTRLFPGRRMAGRPRTRPFAVPMHALCLFSPINLPAVTGNPGMCMSLRLLLGTRSLAHGHTHCSPLATGHYRASPLRASAPVRQCTASGPVMPWRVALWTTSVPGWRRRTVCPCPCSAWRTLVTVGYS